MILLILVLIHVVSFPPTQPLSQKHFPLFLPFPLFIIHPSNLFQHQFYNLFLLSNIHHPFFITLFHLNEDILWLSFDSVTTFLGSLFSHWLGGYVRHHIFETDLRQHHLSTFLSASPQPKYTTLSHLFYHLQLLNNITVDLTTFFYEFKYKC